MNLRAIAAAPWAIVGCSLWSLPISAEDWPTFRGADRTAVVQGVEPLESWGSDGPALLWTASGAGRGYASPAVAEGRIYTLGDEPSTASDGDEYLTCFDARDGRQLWMTKVGPAWTEGQPSWQGARSTPTVDSGMVFAITPQGVLVALRTEGGELVWKKDLASEFAGEKGDGWGYSESPLVDGDKLLCTPGGKKSTLVALNKKTGQTIWSCVRSNDQGAGHSSIVISQVGGRRVYVQNTAGGPMGVDAETGELLWQYECDPPTAYIPSPIVQGDLVFTYAAYGLGGALLRQVPQGGAVRIEEVYGFNRELQNKHGGVLLIGDHLYGGQDDNNIIFCAELATGKILWKERGSGADSISVVGVGNKLIVRFQNGVMALASISPDGYREISSFKLPGTGESNRPSWSHPVIANGKLYVREGDAIYCFQVGDSTGRKNG